jgi:predicted glutamine amidotransferase
LCQAVQSDCMIAHVRAASVFAGISQQNCHPFKAGRLLFCHNGRIGQFDLLRRQFHTLLSDESYMNLKGTTDSETLFALLCTYLSHDGCTNNSLAATTSPYTQTEPFGHERLTAAVKKVLKTIKHILSKNTPPLLDSNFSTLNFCISGTNQSVKNLHI